MLSTLYISLIAAIPSLTILFGFIITVLTVVKKVKDLTTSNDEVKKAYNAVQDEYRKLRKTIALAIQKQVKIDYNSLSEVKNDKDLQD